VPDIGVFALLDKNTLMFSTKRLRKWPNGACQFIEDKVNPPNRAYLKLWEALDLLNRFPKPQDSVLDLGASPGGWNYVMH
jgi:23S rRNA (cytidine2498-2'-O)-methyltransferase